MREKRSMRNKRKEAAKLLEDRSALVSVALDAGKMVRRDICDATGLTMLQLKNLFQENREIYAKYVVARKTVTDIASDNIVSIVSNTKHPHHFQASKYVLDNFKSDLDETLDSADSAIQIEPLKGGSKNAVQIVFSSSSKK